VPGCVTPRESETTDETAPAAGDTQIERRKASQVKRRVGRPLAPALFFLVWCPSLRLRWLMASEKILTKDGGAATPRSGRKRNGSSCSCLLSLITSSWHEAHLRASRLAWTDLESGEDTARGFSALLLVLILILFDSRASRGSR
jgi:hypothetical protein